MKKFMTLRKSKKGFTLVELLVVLVILAILAAAIIPSMMGFIDKAKNESSAAECRNVLLATQVLVNEEYGKGTATADLGTKITSDNILKMAGLVTPAAVGAVTYAEAGTPVHPYITAIESFTTSAGKVYSYTGDATGKGTWILGAAPTP